MRAQRYDQAWPGSGNTKYSTGDETLGSLERTVGNEAESRSQKEIRVFFQHLHF